VVVAVKGSGGPVAIIPKIMKTRYLPLIALLLVPCWTTLFAATDPASAVVTVRNAVELKAALAGLRPGTTLRIAPGEYPGGNYVSRVAKLTIEALDPQNPPLFQGGSEGWHFSRCDGLTLRHLRVRGQTGNGINIDDGGELTQLVSGTTIERVEVSDIGPQGNHDGFKLSGVAGLTIRDCKVTGWGGQAIDLVGCHRALITGCQFVGKPGFSTSAGVQTKGGSADITVEKCRFIDASPRPVNIGGSTGVPYFRPPGAKYEAARIVVRDNLIEGGQCAAAFVGVDGAEFTGNTILHPTKWIFRILQETRLEGFVPCRNVLIARNRIVFRRAQVQVDINIGEQTAPETFRFEGNHWFAEDRPLASPPKLPVAETGGVHGTDPRR